MESMLNGQIFPTFQAISNELGNPKLLICPSDNRAPATSFSGVTNISISYFFGVDVTEAEPYFFMVGDRNLTNGPLTTNRLLPLTTNSAPGWDDTMHNLIGNVALADGSVPTFTIPQLRQATANMVSSGSQFTNRLAFP